MLHRETEQYLKTNQIKHSSFYCNNKAFLRSSRQCFLHKDHSSKISIDALKNYSFVFENKSNSVELYKNSEFTYSPGKGHKLYQAKRSSFSFQVQSERNRARNIFGESHCQAKPEDSQERKSKIAMRKLKNEIIFQNQLLTKPIGAEYFPKIKLTKRKFRLPKTKQQSQYCPWMGQEDQEHSQEILLYNI